MLSVVNMLFEIERDVNVARGVRVMNTEAHPDETAERIMKRAR
jgi:hypothetical protein